MAGVAGLPETNEINGCDTEAGKNNPAESAGNPTECRTSGARKARKQLHRQRRAAKDDPTRFEQVRLLLDMQKHGAAPAFMARQMRIVNRVRVPSVGSKI
jgi:hypothetical protein